MRDGPLVAVYAVLALGIYLSDVLRVEPLYFLLACGLVLLAFLTYRLQRYTLSCCLVLFGFFLAGTLNGRKLQWAEAGRIAPGVWEVRGALLEDPDVRPDKMVFLMRTGPGAPRGRKLAVLQVTVYSSVLPPARYFDPPLQAGDRIRFVSEVRSARRFLNEGSFDYPRYLKSRGVDYLVSLKSPRMIQRGTVPRRSWKDPIHRLRRVIRDRLHRGFGGRGEEEGFLLALFLGDRSRLSARLEREFQEAGLYHVLVVSGMHVGILAFFGCVVLGWLRLADWAQFLILGLAVCLYVLLVGAQAPVARSALLFGIYFLSRILFRRSHWLNSLAFAGLALLLAQPLLLRDAGYQLTFAAVFAIGALGSPLQRWLTGPLVAGTEAAGDPARLILENSPFARRARWWKFTLEDLQAGLERRFQWNRKVWHVGLVCAVKGLHGLAGLLCISVAVQAVLVLPMAFYFHRATWMAPLLNLIFVPWVSVLLPMVAFYFPIQALHPLLGSGWAAATHRWLDGGLRLLRVLRGEGQGPERIPTPPPELVTLFVLSLVAMLLARGRTRLVFLAVFSAAAILVSLNPFPHGHRKGHLTFHFMDVGQGDSTLVVFPRGRTMLVDGGGLRSEPVGDEGPGPPLEWEGDESQRLDIGEHVVSPRLWRAGIRHLDVVLLTHRHQDHLQGLFSILENFKVGEVWVGAGAEDGGFLEPLRTRALARGSRWRILERGKTLYWEGVEMAVLHPPDVSGGWLNPNNQSLVLKLSLGSFGVLLTGDIEREIENELVARGDDLRSALLKVPHHGSISSSTPQFLGRVQARIAVIQAGALNPFNHPSSHVVARFHRMGVAVFQTARDGEVMVATDGRRLEVRLQREREYRSPRP
ncbi:MAG: ComEC/Rec2 family competence protein [Acidobacteria bacterium]|nr:ComEC/Rec2 family competence protein [Acidobacteriota bacterium]